MECPSCRRSQKDQNADECEFCGLVFEKWHAKQELADRAAPAPVPAPVLLDVSSAEIFAYRVDPQLRTLFGLLLYFVDPTIRLVHPILEKLIHIPANLYVAVISFAFGIFIAKCAGKGGYSGVLTAGGAGFLAAILRSAVLLILSDGAFSKRAMIASPIFGIYSFFTFLGGTVPWIFKKFFHDSR